MKMTGEQILQRHSETLYQRYFLKKTSDLPNRSFLFSFLFVNCGDAGERFEYHGQQHSGCSPGH